MRSGYDEVALGVECVVDRAATKEDVDLSVDGVPQVDHVAIDLTLRKRSVNRSRARLCTGRSQGETGILSS